MQRQLGAYFLVLSFMLVFIAKVPAGAPTFTTIDVPGAIYTEALDINDFGQIVGRYYDGNTCTVPCTSTDGHNHGYLLSQGSFTRINFPDSDFTGAAGINPQGDIVGIYHLAGTLAGMNHGFLLSEGVFISIDFPDSISTTAWKINANGIVGRYQSADLKSHVFLMSEGVFTSIDFPGAFDTAPGAIPFVGINGGGGIVSTYCDTAPCTPAGNGNVHGFLLSEGEFMSFDFPGAAVTAGSGINRNGDIVGVFGDASGGGHGFLRSRGEDY